MAELVDPALLRELVDYDPATGKIWWKERPIEFFPNEHQHKAWNSQYAGKQAFNSPHPEGYLSGRIFRRLYYTHRVVYALHHGHWPDGQIDHIDQCKTNNAITNLRVATKAENMRNSKLQNRNKSGCPGVAFKAGRWQAQITHDGTVHYLGRFESCEDAIKIRREKEVELGFSPLHGRVL